MKNISNIYQKLYILFIEGPLGRATPPPAIYDPESCGSDRQKWSAHQDRPIADDGLNWLDIC